MSYVFTEAKRQLLSGEADLDAADLRVALLMTNNTLNTAGEEDRANLGALTLDEFNGAGYARVALAAEAVSAVNAANAGMLDADDPTFGVLANGTRNIAGALLYKHVGADAVNVPIAWYDDAPFPLAPGGTELILRVNALGLLRTT